MKAYCLRCEYLKNPLGIDIHRPRLSWKLESERRAEHQTAYQVLVARTPVALAQDRADQWDSGKIESADSSHVEYQGQPLVSRDRCWWKVRVWNRDGQTSSWSEAACWTMGLLDAADWDARWIGGHPPPGQPLQAVLDKTISRNGWIGGEGASRTPLLRREFALSTPLRRATLYVTARGLYELRLNGHRVGDHYLAPEWTDYRHRIQYQTYEVTEMLRPGPNAVAALLGPGWFAGRVTTALEPYGQVPQLLMQLEIELADGTFQKLVTDSAWRFTDEGPIRSACIFDGETLDATREPAGWDESGFSADGWQPVLVERELGEARLCAQMHSPIRIVREIRAAKIMESARGVYVFDLGQNLAGWARITVRAKPTTVLKVRHDEALVESGEFEPNGIDYAAQTETYTLRGGRTEVLEPHFTYHGFRYIEISGFSEPPSLLEVVGCSVHSDCPEASSFESSHPLLNRLMSNVVWGQRSNLIGILTDCPQRYERLGWLGDAQNFAQTMIFNMDVATLLVKWFEDMRESQRPDGPFPDWAPSVAHMVPSYAVTYQGAPAWGDGGLVIPWCAWRNYGDRRALEQHYPAARRHVDWIHANNPGLLWLNQRGKDWGDWCAIEAMDKAAFSTAWFAHSAALLSRMAVALGKTEDGNKYRALFQGIRDAFNRAYVKADGCVADDTQSAYALALHFDLLPDDLRSKAVQRLLAAIHRHQDHLSTGFHTTHRMLIELSRGGAHEKAARLVLTPTCPSPAYMVERGATTFWETWGEGGAHPAGNRCSSLNHPAFGSIGEWVWRFLVGIEADEQFPAFRRFTVRPRPVQGVNWVRAVHQSLRGPVSVAWTAEKEVFTLDLTVPANTTATLHLPTVKPEGVSEGGHPLATGCIEGIQFLRREVDTAVFQVDSGRYQFRAPR